MKETPLSALSYAQFAAQRNSKFVVNPAAAIPLELELVETKLHPARGNAGATSGECFSLVFAGPNRPLLRQGTYTFEHKELGSFSLFIVPISGDQQRVCYEAVFNRRAAS